MSRPQNRSMLVRQHDRQAIGRQYRQHPIRGGGDRGVSLRGIRGLSECLRMIGVHNSNTVHLFEPARISRHKMTEQTSVSQHRFWEIASAKTEVERVIRRHPYSADPSGTKHLHPGPSLFGPHNGDDEIVVYFH
jgi:hypothetical protein